jgi:hypothetical protein
MTVRLCCVLSTSLAAPLDQSAAYVVQLERHASIKRFLQSLREKFGKIWHHLTIPGITARLRS